MCYNGEYDARKMQLNTNRRHSYTVNLANNAIVRCVSVAKQVELCAISLDRFPCHAILGRPWLVGMRVRQDWHHGEL